MGDNGGGSRNHLGLLLTRCRHHGGPTGDGTTLPNEMGHGGLSDGNRYRLRLHSHRIHTCSHYLEDK